MSNSELRYRLDEWELDGAVICADAELIIDADTPYGSAPVFSLYMAISHDLNLTANPMKGGQAPNWLHEALSAWVKNNQAKLTQHYYDQLRVAAE